MESINPHESSSPSITRDRERVFTVREYATPLERIGAQTISVDWIVLWFTAVMSGAAFSLTMLNHALGTSETTGSYLFPYLPGAAVGVIRFLSGPSPARVPFSVVTVLIFAGLLWSRPTEFSSGITFILILLTTMGISLLYNTRRKWLFGAQWFTVGAMISSLVLFWESRSSSASRLGSVQINGVRVIDPNYVGVFFSIALIVLLALLWNFPEMSSGWRPVASFGVVWFVVIVMLTGSRGSLFTAVAAILIFLFLGRLRWNRVTLGVGLLATVATIVAFWVRNDRPGIFDRFSIEEFGTLGHRTPIWSAALDLMSDWGPMRVLIGEGTGSAPYAIGNSAPRLANLLYHSEGLFAPNGIPRVSAHSSYVEWIVTFGAIGALIGFFLLVNAVWNSLRLDFGQPGSAAFAFLCIFVVTSITLPAYRMSEISIVCGGIALGYIYMSHSSRCCVPTKESEVLEETHSHLNLSDKPSPDGRE